MGEVVVEQLPEGDPEGDPENRDLRTEIKIIMELGKLDLAEEIE